MTALIIPYVIDGLRVEMIPNLQMEER